MGDAPLFGERHFHRLHQAALQRLDLGLVDAVEEEDDHGVGRVDGAEAGEDGDDGDADDAEAANHLLADPGRGGDGEREGGAQLVDGEQKEQVGDGRAGKDAARRPRLLAKEGDDEEEWQRDQQHERQRGHVQLHHGVPQRRLENVQDLENDEDERVGAQREHDGESGLRAGAA